uniref:Uncharacterized protein n=1 Tax=Geospiza parvula TaxID=87175 RepID=A0A8C3MGM1_GEOPR
KCSPGIYPSCNLKLSFLLFSCACAFLDDDPAYECSTNPLTGSVPTHRRSPRLLSNGYYVLTEDSFLSDEEGNITLTPSHTSVTYKENLVRVFRRRKKIRRSLDSLFNLSASSSWLSSTIPSRMDFSYVEDPWPDGCSKLEASHNLCAKKSFLTDFECKVISRNVYSGVINTWHCLLSPGSFNNFICYALCNFVFTLHYSSCIHLNSPIPYP